MTETATGTRRFSFRRRSHGQSLVELALVLPVLLLMVAGALDLGRVFFATITVTNAAREGAIQAAKTPADSTAIRARAQFEAKDSGVTIAAADVTSSCALSGCPRQAGSTVTVSVAGTFALFTPLLSPIFGGQTIPFTSTATAQVEYLPAPGTAADFLINPNDVEWSSPSVTVTFTDVSGGSPTAWLWTFHDGTQASTQNASFAYTQPGTYNVTLEVVNSNGIASVTKTVRLTTTTPSCVHPANVVGMSPGEASAALVALGINADARAILTTGQKGKIQAQNPDSTQCVALGSTVTMDYRPN